MIKRDAELELRRLPLALLHVHEHQQRYPDRLTHYLGLLAGNATDDLGVLHVKRCAEHGGHELLDGHHRFCALILSGRPDALCLVITEPDPAEEALCSCCRGGSSPYR